MEALILVRIGQSHRNCTHEHRRKPPYTSLSIIRRESRCVGEQGETESPPTGKANIPYVVPINVISIRRFAFWCEQLIIIYYLQQQLGHHYLILYSRGTFVWKRTTARVTFNWRFCASIIFNWTQAEELWPSFLFAQAYLQINDNLGLKMLNTDRRWICMTKTVLTVKYRVELVNRFWYQTV